MFENKLSQDVMNCIWKYAEHHRISSIIVNDPMTSLIASLYNVMPCFDRNYSSIEECFEAYKTIHPHFDEVIKALKFSIDNITDFLTEKEIQILLDNFKDVVDYCLNVYNTESFGRYVSTFVQPRQLTRFCLEVANFERGSYVYNPFSGFASYAIMNDECKYDGDEIVPFSWAISQINLFVHNCKANISLGDAFDSLKNKSKQYDGVIMTPPFSMREKNRSEFDAIRMALEKKLKQGGKMVVVMPLSFLFAASGKVVELRNMILSKGYLDMVVTLPPIFQPYASVSTCLLLFSKERHEDCLLFDGTSFIGDEKGSLRKVLLVDNLLEAIKEENSKYCIRVGFNDLLNQNSLMPGNYLPLSIPSEYPIKKLGDLITPYRKMKNVKEGCVVKLVNTQALSLRNIDLTIDVQNLNTDKLRDKYRIVEPNTLLIFPTEKGVRVGRIKNIPEGVIVSCTPNMITARLSGNDISSEYLFLQLISNYVKEQLSFSFLGAIHGVIPLRIFNEIKISIAPTEVQAKQLQKYYQANKSEAEKAIESNLRKYEAQIHLRKHAMSQTLSAISALWNRLNSFRISHNGNLSDDDIVSKAYKMNVGDMFDAITHRLNTLTVQADNLANVEYNWGDSTFIVPSIFIHNYINSHKDVRFLFIEEEFAPIDNPGGQLAILFPEKALEKVFDNIISNALSYGFNDASRVNNKIFISEVLEDIDNFKILISNNGSPIPDEVNTEDVFNYGYSTALSETDDQGHEHHGIGAFEVRNILEEHGASVRIISTPENEYTVTYELTFTKTNVEDE